jgi:hypothetical protein
VDVDELAAHLATFGLQRAALKALVDTFEHAKTFGSLIQIPAELNGQLAAMTDGLQQALLDGDLYARHAAKELLPLVWQALVLGMQFDAVVANPPYMGAKYYNAPLKLLADEKYRFAKGDLYTCFIVQNNRLSKANGIVAMITIPNWMFLSSFEELRHHLFGQASIETFSHNGRGVFGSDFGSCAFTYRKTAVADFKGRYRRLFERQGSVASNDELHDRFLVANSYEASISDFKKIPGSPLAYWVSDQLRSIFSSAKSLGEDANAKQGLATADNDRFLRLWTEVSITRTGFSFSSREEARTSGLRWFPHSKGGEYRKWYGNREWLVNWQNDGEELFAFRPRSVIRSPNLYFKPCLSWTLISSATTAFRFEPVGNIIGHKGPGIFAPLDQLQYWLALLNSCVSEALLKILAPSIGFAVGQVSQIPIIKIEGVSSEPIQIAKSEWDSFERSWDFSEFPWLSSHDHGLIKSSWLKWADICASRIGRTKLLEEENNRKLIEAYVSSPACLCTACLNNRGFSTCHFCIA